MTDKNSTTEQRRFGLTTFDLKFIASIAMLLDHIGYRILPTLILDGYPLRPLYSVLRAIGRLAMPIFCFFVAYGVKETRSRGRYVLRMAILAVISEVPLDLMLSEKCFDLKTQSVIFTLLLGALSSITIAYLAEHRVAWLGFFSTAVYACIGMFARTEYGMMGVLCVTALFVSISLPIEGIKYEKPLRVTMLAFSILLLSVRPSAILHIDVPRILNTWQLPSILATIPLCFFNGQRGRQFDNKAVKYAFYAFYPAHLLLLSLINYLL